MINFVSIRCLFLLFLVSLLSQFAFASLAEFTDPPIQQIMIQNNNLANSLGNLPISNFPSLSTQSGSVSFTFGSVQKTLPVTVGTDIAGVSLMLEDTTFPDPALRLIIARGYQLSHLTSLPDDSNICDYAYAHWLIDNGQGWRCDFDGDDCTEYEDSVTSAYLLDANFTFKGTSVLVRMNSNSVSIPYPLLELMKNSSGVDLLHIQVTGNFTAKYVVDNRRLDGDSCYSYFVNSTTIIPVSLSRSYRVAGANKLFFLEAPILREQWFRNNRYDMIVLSQAPIYQTIFTPDDNLTGQSIVSSLYEFSITDAPGGYGLKRIKIHKTNESDFSESRNLSTPIPLEQFNHSFYYVYVFNQTYLGIGTHNVSFSVRDVFLGEAIHQDIISSKMLSLNNRMENGSTFDPAFARSSISFPVDYLNSVYVLPGLAALILILAFLGYKRR